MADGIYGPSVPHLQVKTVFYKVQNMEPIIVPKVPKGIIDRYKHVTILCDSMHTNGIGLHNVIYWHILFAMISMLKYIKVKNIEDRIKQANKLYLQRGFKITCINPDSEFKPLQSEMADLGISINWASKKKLLEQVLTYRLKTVQVTM